jgi:hypothetical protein
MGGWLRNPHLVVGSKSTPRPNATITLILALRGCADQAECLRFAKNFPPRRVTV